MTEEGHNEFIQLKAIGKLLTPDTPAAVISNLALKGGGNKLNGKAFDYSSEELADYYTN